VERLSEKKPIAKLVSLRELLSGSALNTKCLDLILKKRLATNFSLNE
jgi:hypothetical protein